ncbi:MAG TPA: phosphotransferase [Jatrophihabitans sp.]
MSFLQGAEYTLEPLVGGLTNRNYRVSTSRGVDYVARFAGGKSELLSIDRDAEAYNSAVAATLGIGPQVVEYSPTDAVLVVTWIDGSTCTDAMLDDPDVLAGVAACCRTLHSGPRFAGTFDMFRVQENYLRIVRERGFRVPPGYLELADRVAVLDTVLHASADATVACHNDLLAANIMLDGRRIWFIDYEYSGNNDRCFELGNIWSEAELPLDRLEHLVTAYLGRPDPVAVARARLFATMAKYGWTLWASIQDAVSDVDFDFWTWGLAKYERAAAEFGSPDLNRLIDTVSQSIGKGAAPWPQST